MRSVLILCGAMLAASWNLPASAAEPQSLVGKDAPDFVLKANDGSNLRLSEFRGQVVLVNFWARWAGDTHREMRALDKINTTYERAGLVVLGVSIDEDLRRAQEFADSMKVSYPIMFDTGSEIGRDYQLAKMPMTVLVDRSGVVRFLSRRVQARRRSNVPRTNTRAASRVTDRSDMNLKSRVGSIIACALLLAGEAYAAGSALVASADAAAPAAAAPVPGATPPAPAAPPPNVSPAAAQPGARPAQAPPPMQAQPARRAPPPTARLRTSRPWIKKCRE